MYKRRDRMILVRPDIPAVEIENIITTHDELYRALVAGDSKFDAETKEALNYRSAVWAGFRLLRQSGLITTSTLVAIQQEMEQNNAGFGALPGTALVNDRSGEAIYTPPDDEQTIRNLLPNLEEYLNQADETDPLIKMAVAHYQFELIHPFYDGHVRTGRILHACDHPPRSTYSRELIELLVRAAVNQKRGSSSQRDRNDHTWYAAQTDPALGFQPGAAGFLWLTAASPPAGRRGPFGLPRPTRGIVLPLESRPVRESTSAAHILGLYGSLKNTAYNSATSSTANPVSSEI